MANKFGHNVGAPITTYQEGDTYATHYANEGQGGYKTVSTLIERDNIPDERRVEGMSCFVTTDGANGSEYKLIGGITNSDWKKVDGVNGSFTSSDGSSVVVENGIITNITPVGFIETQMYDLVT